VGKTWVLETHTKGTGANMVPLERRPEQPREREPQFAMPKLRTPVEAPHEPKRPARFKVVDLMTDEVLADDVGAREAVAALRDVRSVVDVRVYMWHALDERWRLLTQREQKALWGLRDRALAASATPSR
jgi:hypothetical protein